MASEGGHWLLPIPCCSREYRSDAHLQATRQSALAERLGSSQPTRKEEVGVTDPRSSTGGYPYPESCIATLTPASTPLILHKSRMRRRARTDPSGGRSVMSVPTGTTEIRTDCKFPDGRRTRDAFCDTVDMYGYSD